MPPIIVTLAGVEKLLTNIKPNKASGPDAIPCRVLKDAAHELAPVLVDIFNTSLSSGKLPADWRTARVALVFKKGNTNEPANHCPIFFSLCVL